MEECVPSVKQNQLRGVSDPTVEGLGRGLQEVKNTVKPAPVVKIPKIKKKRKVTPDQAMKECKKSLAEAEWGIEDVLNYKENFFPKAKPQAAIPKAIARIFQGTANPSPKPKPQTPAPPAPVQPKNGWLSKSGYKSIKKVISHSLGICKNLDGPKKARILKIHFGVNSEVLPQGIRSVCMHKA